MYSKKFSSKVAIVTGSSCGIGQGIALLLAQQGAAVTIHGRSLEGLEETFKLITDSGVSASKVLQVQGDISDATVAEKLIGDTVAKFGKLDVLVNNAAVLTNKSLSDEDAFDQIMAINVKSVVRLNKLAVPHLEKTKGNIINVSSVASMRVFSGETFYAMTKIALDHYMRHEAAELAKKGIRMNNLNPGIIRTKLLTRTGISKDDFDKMADGWAEQMCPLRRTGTAREMATVVAFLASDDASYVTGTTIVADGGLLLGSQ
ncbi:hypothetical protein QR680_010122 [Steinernema hermaphroditum]|uniref:Uncharacterized protein n=1 Tax=Steinernema hermaphroditum TaxID=289476 RepID=A0AA39IMU0_9BILA|nr:hypothetical protein QR680_010122 [Steinernema hermaphroditum]